MLSSSLHRVTATSILLGLATAIINTGTLRRGIPRYTERKSLQKNKIPELKYDAKARLTMIRNMPHPTLATTLHPRKRPDRQEHHLHHQREIDTATVSSQSLIH
jgi:hypothetical protein